MYVYILFGIAFVILGYLGVKPPSPLAERLAQVCTFIYFGFFLLMPWWSKMGTFKRVPDRVTFHPH
jgi:ubiquinol-cytochrome c reductase cytochrome b subunit